MGSRRIKKRWISTSGWHGYEEPIMAVVGANDTGMFADSPCRSDIANKELNSIIRMLKENNIKSRKINCATSNLFCIARYVVPFDDNDVPSARQLVREFLNSNVTTLLYSVDDVVSVED